MGINFDTDKMIAVIYPPNHGGKFLINCLGLGNNAVLQDSTLAERQIKDGFLHNEKLQLLLNRLDQVGSKWNDLNLGCSQYFGNVDFTNDGMVYNKQRYNPVVSQVIDQGWYAFKALHTSEAERLFCNHWKNTKYIRLHNFFRFYHTYRHTLNIYWNKIAGSSWPQAPTSIEEFYQLPDSVVYELKNNFEGSIETIKKLLLVKNYTVPMDEKNTIYWDNDWYLNEDLTIDNIEKIYQKLDIQKFIPDSIRIYRKKWLETLTRLSKSHSNIYSGDVAEWPMAPDY